MCKGFKVHCQRVVPRGNGNQVDVVGHQAIGENLDLMAAAVFFQPFEINLAVFFREKHIVPAVAALGDVVGKSGEYGACESWHEGEFTKIAYFQRSSFAH